MMTNVLSSLYAALADRYRIERRLGHGGTARAKPQGDPS